MIKSRWITDDEHEEDDRKSRRRTEKEEKRRMRKERADNEPTQNSVSIPANHSEGIPEVNRPTKRQKVSTDAEAAVAQSEEESVIWQFPPRTFGPCGDVTKYDILNGIEQGSYGMVSRARDTTTGEIIALKHLKIDRTGDGFPVTGLREIQTLKASSHPGIVSIKEVVLGNSLNDVYIVMEFLEHDLKTILEDMAEPFLPSEVKALMLQIVSATKYLHANWIMHRDLKTTNLLLNNRGEVKLADFGMARYTGNPPPRLTRLVVTLWYRAPELLLGTDDYGFDIDIWSLGCIFAEILTRNPLFQGKNEVDQLSKIFAALGTPTAESWPGFRSLPNAKALHPVLSKPNHRKPGGSMLLPSTFPYLTASGFHLISSMLSMNPRQRPSASAILESVYFQEEPRPKPKEMFPTFPSRANLEKKRRRTTPQAPVRGEAPVIDSKEFQSLFE